MVYNYDSAPLAIHRELPEFSRSLHRLGEVCCPAANVSHAKDGGGAASGCSQAGDMRSACASLAPRSLADTRAPAPAAAPARAAAEPSVAAPVAPPPREPGAPPARPPRPLAAHRAPQPALRSRGRVPCHRSLTPCPPLPPLAEGPAPGMGTPGAPLSAF